MYKFFSVAVLILILNTSCSLIKEQDVFNIKIKTATEKNLYIFYNNK